MNVSRLPGTPSAGIVLQRFEKWSAGRFQFFFQPSRAVAVSAGPCLSPVFIAALPSIMSILHSGQIEILFPVRSFFQQRRGTVADFHPSRSLVRTNPRVLHIAQILSLRDRTLTERLSLNRLQQIVLASRF
jgi:hypothetical protein